ncbi:MAG: hypothetical protein ABL907_23265 [Hyphomicrobium sp.]
MILLILAIILIAYFGIGYAVWRVARGRAAFTRLAILLAVMVGPPYTLFQTAYPTVTHRYRLTLVADDNGKPVTGSSVIEASYWKAPMFMLSPAEYGSSARGEAVAVDFGEKGVLFALLKGEDVHSDASWIVRTAFGIERFSPPDAELRKLRALRGSTELPFSSLPILVRFRDINDPKTVERVDPNNLAASFGPGVKLINVTIEIVHSGLWPLNVFGITGTPLTTGIEKQLAWLPNYYDKLLDGDRTHGAGAENRLANSLGSGNFKIPR